MDGHRELPHVQACTLPTPQRPMRLAEFDDLFATAVTSLDRPRENTVRFGLAPDPRVAARAADLVVRESECCAFFTFTLSVTGARVELEVTAPQEYAAVVDGLASRAAQSVRPAATDPGARS